jgi:plasmid stabilization system protein ParE
MKFTNIYTPEAANQYEEIVAWYKERSIVASENFINELETKVKKICVNPFRYRNTYKHFRETALKKFPYYVIYSIDEKNIIIYIAAIYHTARNPKKKYRNL